MKLESQMMAITTSISINEAPFDLRRRDFFQGKFMTAARKLTLLHGVINHRFSGLYPTNKGHSVFAWVRADSICFSVSSARPHSAAFA